MTWHLLLDEMYPPALARAISDRGHDVLAVAALADLAGSPDEAVLAAASAAGRCLVTENVRDFAVLIRHVHHQGVLFVNAQRWPRTPGGIKRLAEALDQAIRAGHIPGQGEARWLT
jgi:Domain of unknown function (DUF5615)